MTIGRQVAEPLIYHQDKSTSVALAEVVDLLAQVQIGEGRRRLTDYPHQFSGGMRQRGHDRDRSRLQAQADDC